MQQPRDLDLMSTAARLVGAGHTFVSAARAVNRDESTVRRWSKLPQFQAERERALAGIAGTPRAVFLDALTARRDDGVDWASRIRAAERLLELAGTQPAADEHADLAEGWG
ncbi:MAG: hypothetical protein ACR2M2_03500 [Gaiellaceae bacterium]